MELPLFQKGSWWREMADEEEPGKSVVFQASPAD